MKGNTKTIVLKISVATIPNLSSAGKYKNRSDPSKFLEAVRTAYLANVRKERQMLNVAMLYGDSVQLVNPWTHTLSGFYKAETAVSKHYEEFDEKLSSTIEDLAKELKVRGSANKSSLKQKTLAGIALIAIDKPNSKLGKYINESTESFTSIEDVFSKYYRHREQAWQSVFRRFTEGLGGGDSQSQMYIRELVEAESKNILSLQKFEHFPFSDVDIPEEELQALAEGKIGFQDLSLGPEKGIAEIIEVYLRLYLERGSFLFLDDFSSSLLERLKLKLPEKAQGFRNQTDKHTALAIHLLRELPLFEKATFEEITDIRQELNDSLIYFRSGMVKLSKHIEDSPMSPGFIEEANLVFHEEIAPAITDIKERVEANKYLKQLWDKGIGDPKVVSGVIASTGVIGAALATPETFSNLVVVGLSVGGASGLISKAKQVANEWREENTKIRSHKLYLYYRLHQQQ